MSKILKRVGKYKIIVLVSTLVCIGLVARTSIINKKDSKTTNNTITVPAKKGNLVESVSASGQVTTANYLSVTTSVNGIVKEVYVKEGDKVESGQKIMDITLDSEGEKSRISSYSNYLKAANSLTEAQKTIPILEAAITEKEAEFNTLKETNSYQSRNDRVAYSNAEVGLQEAKDARANKLAQISNLRVVLSSAWLDYSGQSSTITAPTNGVIASVLAVAGSKIENSVSERSVKTVAAIKKEGTPVASLNIGETDINKVKVGQKVTILVTSAQNKRLSGTVAGIDKIGTVVSGVTNYPVTIRFDKDSEAVLPNMTVQADIIIKEKKQVLFVPSSAVQHMRGKSIVTVIENGAETHIPVQTGLINAENTEIISGLVEGDIVVIQALPMSGFSTTQSQQNSPPGGFGAFGTGNFNRRQ